MTSAESSPRCAVVTVTYSPGEHLGRFLDSLDKAYSGSFQQIVLADNGSTDGVPEAAAEQSDAVYFLPTGGNIGYGAAMNRGVKHLRNSFAELPEFLLLSNPDVEFTPGSIDELIACAEHHPGAGAIGPRILESDGTTYPSARSLPSVVNGAGHAVLGGMWPSNPFSAAYRADEDMDTERTAGWLSGSCLLIRSQAFEAIGGFDERYFMYLEDVDLGDRLTRAGYTNVYCPTAVIRHAQGHSTKSRASLMLPAHHASAYRYQADRHPGLAFAPLRIALKLGLGLRKFLSLAAHRRAELRR